MMRAKKDALIEAAHVAGCLLVDAAFLVLFGGGLYGCGLFLRWIIHP